MSGAYDDYLKYGDVFSYVNTSRAKIFNREHSNIVDVDSMIKVMRFNNYTFDPFSTCDCNPPVNCINLFILRLFNLTCNIFKL